MYANARNESKLCYVLKNASLMYLISISKARVMVGPGTTSTSQNNDVRQPN